MSLSNQSVLTKKCAHLNPNGVGAEDLSPEAANGAWLLGDDINGLPEGVIDAPSRPPPELGISPPSTPPPPLPLLSSCVSGLALVPHASPPFLVAMLLAEFSLRTRTHPSTDRVRPSIHRPLITSRFPLYHPSPFPLRVISPSGV